MVSYQTINRVFIESFGEFMIIFSAVLIVQHNANLMLIMLFIIAGVFLKIFGNEISHDFPKKKFWKRFFRLTP